MNQILILVLGEDSRQKYLADELSAIGFDTLYDPCGTFEHLPPTRKASCMVYPIFPSTKVLLKSIHHLDSQALLCAGLASKDFLKTASEHNLSVYDYMSDIHVRQKNAVATAEGAIAEALRLSRLNLQNSNCLILGFGLCGEILAKKCDGLGANVTVFDKDSLKLSHAVSHGLKSLDSLITLEHFTYIFNTIPAPVLTMDLLKTISADGTIVDLATSPGGTDFDFCLKTGIPAKLCPGLPAVYSPKSSGIILAQAIMNQIKRHFSPTSTKKGASYA